MADTNPEQKKKELKLRRRNAKAALTRLSKTLVKLMNTGRNTTEIKESMNNAEYAYNELVNRHQEFTELIEDEVEFEREEEWLDESRETFLQLKMDASDYVNGSTTTENNEKSSEEPSEEFDEQPVRATDRVEEDEEELSIGNTDVTAHASRESLRAPDRRQPDVEFVTGTCGFQMEKPKLPKFGGDVREYVIFRADFKHIVESRHSKRDSLTMLRACLEGKPLISQIVLKGLEVIMMPPGSTWTLFMEIQDLLLMSSLRTSQGSEYFRKEKRFCEKK